MNNETAVAAASMIGSTTNPAVRDGRIRIANILLDPDSRQFFINGRAVRLTPMEFDLVSYLAVNRSRAVSRNELLKEIWGFENIVETRATDDMIKRLRKKLKTAGSRFEIATVWGFGFKIVTDG